MKRDTQFISVLERK